MSWTEQEPQALPESDGFRLRGKDTTRLETFVDAAFAFAMTMVVISVSEIPSNYPELITALKGIPAFAASFALIMLFWSGHRNWSRRYGLEDSRSIALSLGLIFVMLVYVYPLKLMFSSFFSWLTGGWLPSQFAIVGNQEMLGLFMIYGIGYGAMAGALALLHLQARLQGSKLGLDALEQVRTDEQIASWSVQAITGLASAAFAGSMPETLALWAGFVYCTLPISMPWITRRYQRLAEAARGG